MTGQFTDSDAVCIFKHLLKNQAQPGDVLNILSDGRKVFVGPDRGLRIEVICDINYKRNALSAPKL